MIQNSLVRVDFSLKRGVCCSIIIFNSYSISTSDSETPMTTQSPLLLYRYDEQLFEFLEYYSLSSLFVCLGYRDVL